MSQDDFDGMHHVKKMGEAIKEMIDHFRKDIEKVEDPKFKVLFGSAVHVLEGLLKAFEDYAGKAGKA